MNILSEPTVTFSTIETNLPAQTATLFRSQMLPELWTAAVHYGVDPVGMVAQSGHETGWGTYMGKVKPWFYNTAGIKCRHHLDSVALIPSTDGEHPLAHQQFPSWEVGALAHAQHLRAYCNVPVADLVVDPRYSFVIGRHQAVRWADLSGKWAVPGVGYGEHLEETMERLRGA